MPVLIKINIPSKAGFHHRFEWNSREYKKLIGFFCSPDVQLALVFNDGRQVFLRQLDYEKMPSVPPNSRVIFVEKELNNEIITGVLSHPRIEREQFSVYLILEK